MRPERASSSDVSWRRLLDSRTQEAVITGSSALHEDIICLILLRPGQDSVSRHLQCIIHHRGAAAGFLFMLRSFWNQQSSLLSCWHWQRDCYPCCGSWAVSLHHSGVVSKSDDMIGQMCGAAVTGQQCLLWRESRLSEVCWSQSQGPTKTPRGDSVLLLCVCVCVCVCVGALSRRSYQLLNHPSNYRGNRASITPSIIQGRQTERQNAARDVTAEWRDNKERGEGRRRRRRRGNEEEGHEEKKRRIFD